MSNNAVGDEFCAGKFIGVVSQMYNHQQSIKEVARHVLFRCGLIGLQDTVRRWRGRPRGTRYMADLQSTFASIYDDRVWVARQEQDSLSGPGSTKLATRELVAKLSSLLEQLGCRQLVDVGCGDFNWMRDVEGDFDYLGVDLVPSVIESNQAKYEDSRRRFACLDATQAPVPAGDVVVCREVLFHLSFADGQKLLHNIGKSDFKYLLLTTDSTIWFNSDIRSGDFRLVNLRKRPFNFPPPLHILQDDKVSTGRVLAAWSREQLPSSIFL